MQKKPISKRAKTIRLFRKIHRSSGLVLLVFILNIAITGILLGWKKDSKGLFLPNTQKGISSNLIGYQPLDSLKTAAIYALHQHVSPDLSVEIDRIDVRPPSRELSNLYLKIITGGRAIRRYNSSNFTNKKTPVRFPRTLT